MKKTFAFAILAVTLLLSGCFGSSPEVQNPTVNNEKQSTPLSSAMKKESVTADDQGFYIQARNTKNTALCAKIKDASLKSDCEKEVKAIANAVKQNSIETDENLDLKAHATGDIGLCAKIKNTTLKTTCETEVGALIKK